MSASFPMYLRPARLARAGRFLSLALLVAGCATPAPPSDSSDPSIVVREVRMHYADVREALEDAIRDEGLVAPTSSAFGAMLARTAADLGHAPNRYGEAEILSFCSARVSARLVAEDVRNIALCPLTIALYTLPQRPGIVFVAYRPPPGPTAGAAFARDMLERFVARAASN